MMHEKGEAAEAGETFIIDLVQEIYLRGREEPVCVNTTFELAKEGIDKDDPVPGVMGRATSHLMSVIDVVREHRYMLSDRRHSKFIWLTDELQGVSIIAPDKSTVLSAMEVE